eukprot:GFUD01039073.1.p1 GENE.GFUD01039073.1~~GFUD01039073.1.p1  ORF type:complete len:824 (+),score=148.06 GFUD01039073.1:349-2820(+)
MTDAMQLRKQNSGGFGSSGSSQENLSNHMYNAANYNTIMVEYENGNREMAVDVPASFVAQAKTPPRYPPQNPRYQPTLSTFSPRSNDQNSSTSSKMSKSSSAGASNGSAGGVPPPTGSRDHLKIEKDGNLVNKSIAPELPSRPQNGPRPVSTDYSQVNGQNGIINDQNHEVTPSKEQYERIARYQQEIKQLRVEKDAKLREEEFLRSSMRQSERLRALEHTSSNRSLAVKGVNNAGYSNMGEENVSQTSISQVTEALNRLKLTLPKSSLDALFSLEDLVQTPDFSIGLDVCNKLQAVWCYSAPPAAVCCEAQELAEDCLSLSDGGAQTGLEHEPAAQELAAILRKESLEGLLYVHDKLAERYSLLNSLGEDDVILDRVSHYAEPNIKVVKLEKTSEPLGATVKNEIDAVVVGRIIKGGAADRSGLLHEGDEILEVNEVELRGKNVNEVCDILARMTGTLTMLVVPVTAHDRDSTLPAKPAVVHLKAQIDYEAEDDQYVPCRELGISFHKGDILHVINQQDPHWWQAYREGEENTLAGLIPSPSFHSQRVSMKQTIADEVGAPDSRLTRQNKSKGFLCARRSNKRKKKEIPYSAHYHDEFDAEDTVTYEEVALYYPRPNRKRPVVLIGPPNIGRHELRQRLMTDNGRFSAAIPHTSRTRRDDELDGADYHFITRLQFEQDILARKFVEHGEYEKAYYGTSLEAIRSVVNSEKICVLNLHPQSLRILKSSDLMPYVVFVAPPSLQQLKRWKMENLEQVNDDELEEIIERAREMEERYGHYFDMIIIYSDPDRAYQQLLDEINLLEREPQWVPAAWLRKENNQSFY